MKASYYKDLLKKHGPVPAAVDAGPHHEKRLRALIAICPDWTSTVLDVGCGIGLLLNYKMAYGKDWYRGIDVLPEMVEAAKKLHPGYAFEVLDINAPSEHLKSDYVLASGLFQFGTQDTVWDILQILFKLCRQGVAVNFLRAGAPNECIMSPSSMTQMALAMTPYFSIKADYLPNDFTVYLYKEPQ